MTSLYIHIPFCLGRCEYCSFNSYPGMGYLYERYTKAIKKELVELFFAGNSGKLSTIFFGGGTPSLLGVEQIGDIISCCSEYFGLEEGAEISLEANPKSVDFMKLIKLKEVGVNRLSIGVQSFIDSELDALGRLHDAQQGWDCVRDAMGAGFVNISLDLMYGVPGQSVELWKWNLESALSLGIPHLSLYQLTIEENTPFDHLCRKGDILLPTEDEILMMDELSVDLSEKSGLKQYEISNFSIYGFECDHNLNYWRNGDYLGVGAGAVSYVNGKRNRNISDPVKYCEVIEKGENRIENSEKLDTEASFRETVIIGLRMVKGVSYSHMYDRFGIHLTEYYGNTLDKLFEDDLLQFSDGYLCLTKKGRAFANQVLAELV